jgi:hypothetical protein
LSQWRGYGSGGGYALGFGVEGLRRVRCRSGASGTPDGWLEITGEWCSELVSVGYRANDVEAMAQEVASETRQKSHRENRMVGVEARDRVLRGLASVKDGAFSEEQEHRIVVTRRTAWSSAPVEFRLGAGSLIPYLSIDAPLDDGLERVVIGPGPDAERREKAVRDLLISRGLGHVAIARSQAPFRG